MRRMQWIAITVATAAIALNYIDRSNLAIGAMTIRQECRISATAIGALQSFWSLTYACFQIPVGFALDRLGPAIVLAIGAGITILGAIILQTVVRQPISAAELDGSPLVPVPAA